MILPVVSALHIADAELKGMMLRSASNTVSICAGKVGTPIGPHQLLTWNGTKAQIVSNPDESYNPVEMEFDEAFEDPGYGVGLEEGACIWILGIRRPEDVEMADAPAGAGVFNSKGKLVAIATGVSSNVIPLYEIESIRE